MDKAAVSVASRTPVRLTSNPGIGLGWLASRCLLPAPWNIDCHDCRDACPETALSVIDGENGACLHVSDACTNCQKCLTACGTEALMAAPATLSRRELFRRAINPALSTVDAANAAPAPRKRWRMEAARDGANTADEAIPHPRVSIDAARCDASGLCSQLCPTGALQADDDGALHFDSHYCLGCAQCESVCPNQAIGLQMNGAPHNDVLRQAEPRQCSACSRAYQDVVVNQLDCGDAVDAEDWSQLPLCPACQRDQALMKTEGVSLFR